MPGVTTNKAFPYPVKGDPARETDVAGLMSDIDYEIAYQVGKRRDQVRQRPCARLRYMGANVNFAAGVATNVPLDTVNFDPYGMANLANNRLVVPASAGAGLYLVSATAYLYSPATGGTSLEVTAFRDSAVYLGRQKRKASSQRYGVVCAAVLAVGSPVYLQCYYNGTGTPYIGGAYVMIYKVSD